METLEEIDVLVSQIPALEEKRRLVEVESQKIEALIEQRKASLETDLARISNDLVEAEKLLQGDTKATYLRLVAGRKEEALAELEDNSCSQCKHKPLSASP